MGPLERSPDVPRGNHVDLASFSLRPRGIFSACALPSFTLIGCLPIVAQETGVSGRVLDATSATIANAIVTAAAEDGARISTITNGQGFYQFPTLRGARYTIRFESPGFAPAEKTFNLLVGQMATIDIALQPASTTSTVNVVADTAAVETTSSAVGGTVNPSQVHNLPRNGRNWLELAMMAGGLTRTPPATVTMRVTACAQFPEQPNNFDALSVIAYTEAKLQDSPALRLALANLPQ